MKRLFLIPVFCLSVMGCEGEDECRIDDDCPMGEYCQHDAESSYCKSDCRVDPECNVNFDRIRNRLCNKMNGKCYEVPYNGRYCARKCSNDNDCQNIPMGQQTTKGKPKCISGHCKLTGCTEDSDCYSGYQCYQRDYLVGYPVGLCCLDSSCRNWQKKCETNRDCDRIMYGKYGGNVCDKATGKCYCLNNDRCSTGNKLGACIKWAF